MARRYTFLSLAGPGLLAGITLGDWVRLLRENRFAVAPRRFPRAMTITFHAIQNSAFRWWEHRRYEPRLKHISVLPPLFVLGHGRSGTTHLYNLVTVDRRFAFPNTYQAIFPHTFLSTEAIASPVMSCFVPKRRPVDNIALTLRSPQEDEIALCVSTFKSPYLGWVFPQRREHYDRYLTFRDVPEAELTEWRETLLRFLRKLTWRYGRPLVLKSPPHTCRIRLLLGMFPEARFVHIHRDPYAVFRSAQHTFRVNFELNGLQRPRLDDLDEWILRWYRITDEVFFEERSLVPKRQFHEMCFEELEKDPVGEVRRLYEALELPDFGEIEPALRGYSDSIAGYKKNEFADLPADLRRRIAGAWRPCFEEWGYPE